MRLIWLFVVSGKAQLICALLNILYFLVSKKGMSFFAVVIICIVLWVVIGIFTFHNTNFTHPFLSLLGAIVVSVVSSIINFVLFWRD